MERLAERTNRGGIHLKGTVANYGSISYECQVSEGLELLEKAMKKLADYEDAEENGLLVRLPFKINKTVWCIDFKRVDRYDITGFSLGKTFTDDEPLTEEELICHYANYSGSVNGSFAVSEIGKTVFFTQEEAEAKLKEMEGENAN